MEKNKNFGSNTYRLCTETIRMKGGAIAFAKDKKYKQIALNNDGFIMESEINKKHLIQNCDWIMFLKLVE